jgi:hypothetical protein
VVDILLLRLSKSVSLENLNLLLQLSKLGRVEPLLVPVASDTLSRSSTNSLKHELGRVDVTRDLCAVSLEVADQVSRVLADRSVVDSLTTSLKKEQSVEGLEQKGVGLVDGTEDLLAGRSKLSEETDQVVSGLTVETRGRLVEEEQEIGLGSKLDTDSDTLSSLDRETVTTADELLLHITQSPTHGKPIIASARSCSSRSSMMSSQ